MSLRRGGKGVYAVPVGCALLALATVLWTSDRVSGGHASDSPSLEVPNGISDEVADALRSSAAAPSSPETFLDDLGKAGDSDGEGGGSVRVLAWDEARDLPLAAEDALRAYRDRGSVTLMSSGYLDLAGNVWAALLRHGSGAVDIMTVSTADGKSSEVRIARLEPDGL